MCTWKSSCRAYSIHYFLLANPKGHSLGGVLIWLDQSIGVDHQPCENSFPSEDRVLESKITVLELESATRSKGLSDLEEHVAGEMLLGFRVSGVGVKED